MRSGETRRDRYELGMLEEGRKDREGTEITDAKLGERRMDRCEGCWLRRDGKESS